MKKPVLVVMAAGIGSRYGAGVKQLASVGPSGELVIDYSVYDAKEAGFETVVFVIRREIEKDFRDKIGERLEKVLNVIYVYQDPDDLPLGFTRPQDREKPWGTGHAIFACRNVLNAPFAVINADDYYGKEAFQKMYSFLSTLPEQRPEGCLIGMAGFILGNTLSDHGTVTRGVCQTDEKGRLIGIEETKEIRRYPDDTVRGFYGGKEKMLNDRGPVSMNFWGFPAEFIPRLEAGFMEFLKNIPDGNRKEEYLLPILVDEMLAKGEAEVVVLPTKDSWFGMTYQEDRDLVAKKLSDMVKKGDYPTPLFL